MNQYNILKITFLSLVLIASVLSSAGCAPASENATTTDNVKSVPDRLTSIQVFFKLDPRLTQGLQMGERWVSPPTYAIVVAGGLPYTVEARVEILGNNGQPLPVNFEWIPEDSEMVKVSPSQDKAVMITIQRDGDSILQVTTPDATKTLSIKAVYKANAIRVEITQ